MIGKNLIQKILVKRDNRKFEWLVTCFLLLVGCSEEQNDSKNFFNEKLNCPPPAVAEFDNWGKSGTQQVCKIKHGPFIAWENGYVHVRGQYENGREAGVWNWYDKDGNVVKIIDYSTSSSNNSKKDLGFGTSKSPK